MNYYNCDRLYFAMMMTDLKFYRYYCDLLESITHVWKEGSKTARGHEKKYKMNDNRDMMATVLTSNDSERFIESEGRRNVASVEAQNRKMSYSLKWCKTMPQVSRERIMLWWLINMANHKKLKEIISRWQKIY